jgi:hypothetical protein
MRELVFFFRLNTAYHSYIIFIIALTVFAFVARFINHFISLSVERSRFGKRGVAEVFTPFLVLLFLTGGQSLVFPLFNLAPLVERSFTHFLNIQIVWIVFWIIMAAAKFAIYEIPITKINIRKLYPVLRVVMLLIMLAATITGNLDHIIATLLAFAVTFLLMRLSFAINHIPLIWSKQREPEESEKIIARWDSFQITLPFNIPKETISKALELVKGCVASSNNVGSNFSVLIKDLSERGIVIEAKYLVLVSTQMKETKHEILSKTLSAFAEQQIPMSPSS